MPVHHLLVWLAAGAACWFLLGAVVLVAPQALLVLAALLVLPWLRRPQPVLRPVLQPVLQPIPQPGLVRDEPPVLVGHSA